MYTSVRQSRGAIDESARLMRARSSSVSPTDRVATVGALVPLLVDQVMAEAGVIEPAVAARAVDQAQGDASRAVSLLRSWVSCLSRLDDSTATWADMEVERRITPAFSEPEGGQYLGASLDYAARLLDLSDPTDPQPDAPPSEGEAGEEAAAPRPPVDAADATRSLAQLPRGAARLEREDLVTQDPAVHAVDITRRANAVGAGRGALGQFLSRAETGALTALAYTAVREGPKQADPTLVELRAGQLPVTVTHPDSGEAIRVGSFTATVCELALYHVESDQTGQSTDARFTLGLGLTLGRVERRAIAAALLDARVRRGETRGSTADPQPSDDAEWLITALDGQEAAGFVEHLKLAHHVSFAADLDRVRSLGRSDADAGAAS